MTSFVPDPRPAPLRLALPRLRGDAPLLRGPARPAAGARDQGRPRAEHRRVLPLRPHLLPDGATARTSPSSTSATTSPAEPSPNTPAWVNHIALRVDSVEALRAAKARLEAAGVEVLGVTDHHIIESIYFFDPNGIRLELTTPTVPLAEMEDLADRGARRGPRSGRAKEARPPGGTLVTDPATGWWARPGCRRRSSSG